MLRGLTRFLVVFMALRVLAPPGVCVCELLQPWERLFADAFGGSRPAGHCGEEDPLFGCTVCQLPPGIEVKQVPAPPSPTLALRALPCSALAPPVSDFALDTDPPTHPPTGLALYLRHCAFLI